MTVKELVKIYLPNLLRNERKRCADDKVVVVAYRHAHPCDPPLGTVVDVRLGQEEEVVLVIDG